MNVREMRLYAKSIVKDNQFIDAHFLRWLNLAYRQIADELIIPSLHVGSQITLVQVDDSVNQYYLPYDFGKTIAFCDDTGRSLDPIKCEDVRQFGEYNSFGSFVQFYEFAGINITPLYDGFASSRTIGIPNRSKTVTVSTATFTSAHVGEYILPLSQNTSATYSNPEDYAYKIASTSGTVDSPSTTCTLERAFRGVISDAGSVGDMTTAYFEIRPKNTKIIRIWGAPGEDSDDDILLEYQRIPSKLANDEDVMEEPRLSSAVVHKAMQMAGWAYREAFMVKTGNEAISEAKGQFLSAKDFDRLLIHNYLTANPQARSYSQLTGRHMGSTGSFSTHGIRY